MADYKCQHHVNPRSEISDAKRTSKNTCCPAKLSVTLMRSITAEGRVSRYQNFMTYLEKLYSRRESWALSFKENMPTRGNNTNNYVEAAMRVLKDKILQRTKTFNLPQLFDLLTSRLEAYYKGRLTDVALGRSEAFQRSRFLPPESNIKPSDIRQIGEKRFEVKGTTPGQTYSVDMDVELCTCPMGHTGAPCKHQAAVVKTFACLSNNLLPITPEMRVELLLLTSGAAVSLDFLQPLTPDQHLSSQPEEIAVSSNFLQPLRPDPHQSSQPEERGRTVLSCTARQRDSRTRLEKERATGNSADHHSVLSDQELNTLDLVDSMIKDISSCRKDVTYSQALAAMARQFHQMKSNPSKLVSAMHCFGRSHASATSKRAAALWRAARRPGPMIPCQPTAIARRNTKLGSKRRLSAGRPQTQNSGPEHSYCSATKQKLVGHRKLADSVACNCSHQK